MNIHETAQQIYSETRPTERDIQFFGIENLRPIQRATLEQIEAHLQNCEDARREFGLAYLDYKTIEFGSTREQIFAVAGSKRKHANRRAGVRALQAKYGNEVAERIVSKHAGRHITLQH